MYKNDISTFAIVISAVSAMLNFILCINDVNEVGGLNF